MLASELPDMAYPNNQKPIVPAKMSMYFCTVEHVQAQIIHFGNPGNSCYSSIGIKVLQWTPAKLGTLGPAILSKTKAKKMTLHYWKEVKEILDTQCHS